MSREGSGPLLDFDAHPRAFGSFQVEAELGAGRFGPVFLGHDDQTGRKVVVRTFAEPLSPEQRQDLIDALHGLCELPLDHPSVARPLATGVEGDTPYLVHSYLDGVPADEFVATHGPQRLSDLAPRLTQAAASIDFAAAVGVHHGALSLRDIIIGRNGTGVSGFGLFQALGHTVESGDDVQALAALALRLLDPADYPLVRDVVAHPPSTALAFAAAFQQAGTAPVPTAPVDLAPTVELTRDVLDDAPLHEATVDASRETLADTVPMREDTAIAAMPAIADLHVGPSVAAVDVPQPAREVPRPEVRFGATLDEPSERTSSPWLRRMVVAASIVLAVSAVFGLGFVLGRNETPLAAPVVVTPPEPTATRGQTYTDEGIRNPGGNGNQGSGVSAATDVKKESTETAAAAKPADTKPAETRRQAEPAPRRASRPVEKPRAAKPQARVASAPTGPATLFVDSLPPGAQVSLDGNVVGRTPLLLSDVRPGEHRVRLSMPMRRVWQTTVDAPAGVRTRVAASLEELQ